MSMQLEEEINESEEEEINEEAADMKRPRRMISAGLVLTIFSVIVIVMIGGLASYYYYTVQSQSNSSAKTLKQMWTTTVANANDVSDQFATIGTYADLTAQNGTDLATAVSTANREARDDSATINSLAGLSVQGTNAAQKMQKFFADYTIMLGDLHNFLDNPTAPTSDADFNTLVADAKPLSDDYNQLLLAGKGIVNGNFPSAVFDLPNNLVKLYDGQTQDDKDQATKQSASQTAAQASVNSFVAAWKARDAAGMKKYLTNGAKGEFNAGILEDSTDITGLRITSTKASDDGTSITIDGQLDKLTPDQVTVSENWEFVLLPQGSAWLIDSWKSLSQ